MEVEVEAASFSGVEIGLEKPRLCTVWNAHNTKTRKVAIKHVPDWSDAHENCDCTIKVLWLAHFQIDLLSR